MRALLDVNVLVALLDRKHVAHTKAHDWLALNIGDGWASCPHTENGCVRIVSNPRYPAPVSAAEAVSKLLVAKNAKHHEFWPDAVTITDPQLFDIARMRGHQQVTDTYLLALAVRNRGRLATFDGGVARDLVRGALSANLVIIS